MLKLVAAGTTNREAAARLFLSEATITSHLMNIYDELGVGDRAAAVAEASTGACWSPGPAVGAECGGA